MNFARVLYKYDIFFKQTLRGLNWLNEQTQLQMAVTGGAIFVSNGKKYLQQPACLSPKSKSVYRVGLQITDLDSLTITGKP